jgi:hypothetical protein
MAAICTLRLFDSTATCDQTASMIAFLGTNALGRSSNSARTRPGAHRNFFPRPMGFLSQQDPSPLVKTPVIERQ